MFIICVHDASFEVFTPHAGLHKPCKTTGDSKIADDYFGKQQISTTYIYIYISWISYSYTVWLILWRLYTKNILVSSQLLFRYNHNPRFKIIDEDEGNARDPLILITHSSNKEMESHLNFIGHYKIQVPH